MNIYEQTHRARTASRSLRTLPVETRNSVLHAFADLLEARQDDILEANRLDIANAREMGIKEAMIDRLVLTEKRIAGIAEGVRQVAALPDPVGRLLEERVIASGICLKKFSAPIGVIGIIYESRPNVTADCAALCFKAASACVLKGGKEAYLSSKAISDLMREALQANGVTPDAVILLEKPTREETAVFMSCRQDVDLLIPRGSKNLINAVVTQASIPVIETGAGVCHTYVDESADFDMAEKIILNAKLSRPSVCNAMETLLIHENLKNTFLPRIARILAEKGVTIYADEEACGIVPDLKAADENSWHTEYNDLIMNLKLVHDTQEAIDHIETYGTHHSDAIITADTANAELFMNNVDSACVYHNASTRFTDGFEFGLGAEIGISTQKLHARGPMGLNELTTYTYRLYGKGETR